MTCSGGETIDDRRSRFSQSKRLERFGRQKAAGRQRVVRVVMLFEPGGTRIPPTRLTSVTLKLFFTSCMVFLWEVLVFCGGMFDLYRAPHPLASFASPPTPLPEPIASCLLHVSTNSF